MRLACHCEATEDCHGDNYVDEFVRQFSMLPEPDQADIDLEVSVRKKKVRVDPPSDTEPDDDAEPAGSGPTKGLPQIQVGHDEKMRVLIDGGGLCSIGTLRVKDRCFPEGLPPTIRALFVNAIDSQEAKQPGWSKALLAKLCDGSAVHEDFSDETSEQIRASIETLLVESGWVREAPAHSRRVGIDFMMIAGILWNSGDPDWRGWPSFIREFALEWG